MTHELSTITSDGIDLTWDPVRQGVNRPYPVTIPIWVAYQLGASL